MKQEPFTRHDRAKLPAELRRALAWQGTRQRATVTLTRAEVNGTTAILYSARLGRALRLEGIARTVGEAIEILNAWITAAPATRRTTNTKPQEKTNR